ncbi:HD domain-containing protein [Halonotius pteroides]|uniref:HD domain-containing protein n=1 Tax=Halonotius pteroides TaxID=268735 RepID=A0A3A6Q907_9EURY|nr:HD domain-containing protein [Halonotius pteroides]RJX48466.1 HD domain-containing protein [Halonotius pteroides]
MKPIKDSVHDYIALNRAAEALIDTPTVQRLRNVKQLSTVRLVYPAANHTRFEHSLGVYHLADTAVNHLDIDTSTAAHLRAAALLHDAGHGPYGHQTEDVIYRRTGTDHDEIHWLLTDPNRPVCQTLEQFGLDPGRVADLVAGEGRLGALVSGELDVDRMDYLTRDAHHTGVPYGAIDHSRLIRELRLENDQLVLSEGNVATAESMLFSRALMNAVVYRHHVSRIAGAMLDRACERYLNRTDVGIESFRRMADHDLLVALAEHVSVFGHRLEHRDLYKRAVWTGIEDVPPGTVDVGYEEQRRAEREIADAAGVDPTDVIVDIPDRPRLKESSTSVVAGDGVQRLEDASELVGGIRLAERARWRLGVYCPDEQTESVGQAARGVLGIV